MNYTYDAPFASRMVVRYGDGNRLEKSSGKLYWYGAGTEILDESDLSGNFTNEYVFFGGKRIAMRTVSTGTIYYYEEDMLGSSRTMVQAGQTSVCFDADFLPFGYEKDVTTTCTQNYKFEGKERDTETNNDDFGARYYTFRLGRWLSADWSAVPAPVPYANLTNPQTLNLYAMVSDNPESFADLDGHCDPNGSTCEMEPMGGEGVPAPNNGEHDPTEGVCAKSGATENCTTATGATTEPDQQTATQQSQNAANDQTKTQNQNAQELLVSPEKKADVKYGTTAREQNVDYNLVQMDSKGKASPAENPDHKIELQEKLLRGDAKICTGQCVAQGTLTDTMTVTAGKGHSVEKRFLIDGHAAKIYDPGSKKTYDFVRVDASVKRGFVFNYGNDPN